MNIRSKLCFAFMATSPIQCVTGLEMRQYIGLTARVLLLLTLHAETRVLSSQSDQQALGGPG